MRRVVFAKYSSRGCKKSTLEVVKASAHLEVTAVVGLLLMVFGKIYNVAAVISHGQVLAFVPKKRLPTYRVLENVILRKASKMLY